MQEQTVEQQQIARMQRLVAVARSRSPRSGTPERETLRQFEILPTLFEGRVTERAVIALRTRGCLWFRGSGKACTHCGLVADGLWAPDLDEELAQREFEEALETVRKQEMPVLCLYVAGSFFDPKELPLSLRQSVLEAISKLPALRRLVVETRPEFLRKGVVRPVVQELGGIQLQVGIGFDSLNPKVRALCLNKHCKNAHFDSAAHVLQDEGAELLTYIVLKPPFLDEGPAIEEAVATARHALEKGAREVSIEPLSVQAGTLAHMLLEQKLHHPPWLWSLIEVLQRVVPMGPVKSGGLVVYPSPDHVPSNCDLCSDQVRKAIQEFNVTQDPAGLNRLDCSCRNEWKAALGASRELGNSVEYSLRHLEREVSSPDNS